MIEMMELENLKIEAVYGCVPANVVDNRELCTALVGGGKAESIVKSTGFAYRRAIEPGKTVWWLMLPAAQKALEGVDLSTIGGVVVVTFSAPVRFPALSIQLQHALGLGKDVVALDLQLACGGYPNGLMIAGQLAAATGKKILLVDGDVQSAHVDAADVNTLAVMSDAATATLVSTAGNGSAKFAFHTDGGGADVLRCDSDGKIRMDGFGVFRFVAGPVAEFLKGFLDGSGEMPDVFAPHQANMYMVRQLAKSLGLADRLLTSGERYANPGSCSVALTLAANGGHGRALLAGFGAGLSAAAALVDIPEDVRRGVIEV